MCGLLFFIIYGIHGGYTEYTEEFAMQMRSTFIALAASLGLAGTAQADILSAGPAYPGNPTGGSVTCRIFNAGLQPVTISLRQIFNNASTTPVALTSDTCTAAIPPLGYCAFAASPGGNFAFSCRINANGSDNNISGDVEVRATNGFSAILPLHR
jgi:hypothetical protein